LPTQTEPGDNIAASEHTEALIASDDQALYLAVIADDRGPQAIRARVNRRDDLGATITSS
jgi:hypothetical protein